MCSRLGGIDMWLWGVTEMDVHGKVAPLPYQQVYLVRPTDGHTSRDPVAVTHVPWCARDRR